MFLRVKHHVYDSFKIQGIRTHPEELHANDKPLILGKNKQFRLQNISIMSTSFTYDNSGHCRGDLKSPSEFIENCKNSSIS